MWIGTLSRHALRGFPDIRLGYNPTRHTPHAACSQRSPITSRPLCLATSVYLTEERGHHHITIDPATDSTAATRAYEKVGFRKVSVMESYWRDHNNSKWRDALLKDLEIRSTTSRKTILPKRYSYPSVATAACNRTPNGLWGTPSGNPDRVL